MFFIILEALFQLVVVLSFIIVVSFATYEAVAEIIAAKRYRETREQTFELFCDMHCKYPEQCSSQEELDEYCSRCPLDKIK